MSDLLTGGMIAISMAMLTAWFALLLRPRPPWGRGALIVTVWVGATGFLGAWGFFQDFSSTPPRLLLFVTFVAGAVVSIIFFSRRGRHLVQTPQWILVSLQAFRVPVEIVLAKLAVGGLLPVEMSYQGRNFDLAVGMSAPLVAAACYRWGERRMRWPLILWNIVGLILLINVAMHGFLSVPTPFRHFHFDVETTIMGSFPMMWLPLFLVPTAFALHFLSLRRSLRRSR